ncbi:hypothetical protein Tco_1070970 [Tanacetum coccineum]|uniref:MAK10-like protein n=1 Tax=Tanacetum coccineum TaxID=301880 RepID=A0ABQ5HMY4_9ASTR
MGASYYGRPPYRQTINQSAGGKLRDLNPKESWAILEDLALYDNESWNDPRDFAKPVKAITFPQDVSSEERGPEPPIKPYSPDSFRMKEVDSLTINTPPSPHVASSHPKDVYCYYRPCIDDPKKHYGFKLGLLGKSASLGVDISNWEMFDDDWGLESKEVSPLGKELSLFDRPNKVERGRILEAHRLEPILQQQISQCMAPSHHDDMHRYYHPHLNSSVGEPSPLSVK